MQPQQLPEAKALSEVHLKSNWPLQTTANADCSFEGALAHQAHVKERNVVVPQFDVAFTQQHRMRRDRCGPLHMPTSSHSLVYCGHARLT